jgi:predicted cupin superfamily sugar epimerase
MTPPQALNKQTIRQMLGLDGHFEGGYFRQTFKAANQKVHTPHGERTSMTAIYYMLTDDSPVDCFHTKHSAGVQCYHLGAPITYHLIHPDGRHETVVVGPDIARGHVLQLAVEGGIWKAAELPAGDFGLVTEVVAPGWEMVLPTRQELLERFPQHHDLIVRLTAQDKPQEN